MDAKINQEGEHGKTLATGRSRPYEVKQLYAALSNWTITYSAADKPQNTPVGGRNIAANVQKQLQAIQTQLAC